MAIPNKRDVNFIEEAIPIKNRTVSVPSRKTARKDRMAKENRLPVFSAFVLCVRMYSAILKYLTCYEANNSYIEA